MTSTRRYLRPIQFVDTPVGRDGEVARLAGAMNWFAAYEVIAVADGRRISTEIWPVAEFPARVEQHEDAEALHALAARIAAPRAPLKLGERVLRFDQPQL